jgi:hypothetical protein
MRKCVILKQAERRYNYLVSQFCHFQFYTVKTGVLLSAGTCAAESVFCCDMAGQPPFGKIVPKWMAKDNLN